jgi:hypothetical protein
VTDVDDRSSMPVRTGDPSTATVDWVEREEHSESSDMNG